MTQNPSPIDYAGRLLSGIFKDFKWTAVASIAVIDVIWMIFGKWNIKASSLYIPIMTVIIVALPLLIPRYRKDKKISICCETIIYSVCCASTTGILSYLAVSADMTTIDPILSKIDTWTGLSWSDYYTWVMNHPSVQSPMRVAYESFIYQSPLVLIYLAGRGRFAYVAEYLDLFAALLIATIAFSLFFPAEGASKYYELAHADSSNLTHFEALRSGAMRTIDLNSMQGLVSMPSFHAITALLLCWAARRTRLSIIIIPLNIAMLVSTPIVGGHYFIDVFIGLVIGTFGIYFRRTYTRNAVLLSSGSQSKKLTRVSNQLN